MSGRHLIVGGEGWLALGGNGQGMGDLERDPLAQKVLPLKGADTCHLSRYEGTDLCQWYGRKADGRFHPYGPIFQIIGEHKPDPVDELRMVLQAVQITLQAGPVSAKDRRGMVKGIERALKEPLGRSRGR